MARKTLDLVRQVLEFEIPTIENAELLSFIYATLAQLGTRLLQHKSSYPLMFAEARETAMMRESRSTFYQKKREMETALSPIQLHNSRSYQAAVLGLVSSYPSPLRGTFMSLLILINTLYLTTKKGPKSTNAKYNETREKVKRDFALLKSQLRKYFPNA